MRNKRAVYPAGTEARTTMNVISTGGAFYRWCMRNKCAALLPLLAAAIVNAAPPPEKVALTNARIIPIVGPEIERGTLLIEYGRITALGPANKVEVPFDAREFDLRGKVLLPGLINVHTQESLDVANESRPVTPQLDAADAIEPASLQLEDALRLGVTAVHVIPGNDCVVGGLGRLVRPIGLSVAEMTIVPGGFLKISVGPRSGYDRMKQMAELREVFAELNDYLGRTAEKKYEDALKEEEKPLDAGPAEARKRGVAKLTPEDLDEQHRNLVRLTGGQITYAGESASQSLNPLGAFIYCEKAMDVGPALRISKDNNFLERTVLVLGGECFKAIDELKQAARPVILPPELIYRETDPLTGDETETFVPRKIADAGLLFALQAGPIDSLAERMLIYQAARCVRNGIARDVALRAITINPAKMLGVAKDFGSLEVGKVASVAVYDGDPLDFTSTVQLTFIDGIPAYQRSKDVRLQRLLAPATQKADRRE